MLVRERRDCFGLPPFSIALDELSDQVVGARFARNTSARCRADRFTGSGIFPDAEDALMDSWTDAAIDVLDGLAALGGHESSESLVDVDADDPVALALRLRRNTKGDE